MNLFYYDKQSLEFKKINHKLIYVFLFLILLIFCIFTYSLTKVKNRSHITKNENVVQVDSTEYFSEDNLKDYLKELNIKFPWIVFAQSKLESNNFKSKLFIENNNLFGMKHPKSRVTTSTMEYSGYSFYCSWKESILDYALYQARYLSNIKNEKEYYEYLQKSYAGDSLYSLKIKKIADKYKEKFIK